ncbi:MAG: DNA mismatch repair protein MutS [Chloroflexota bacterium]
MMAQYRELKRQHEDCLLMFRLGDFYELFFDDAVTAARELEITLTGRDAGNGERAPMCGVPYHAVDGYVARLVEKGYRVAICEQMEDPRLAKGLVARDVVRIVTRGTLTDSRSLDERANTYLAALTVHAGAYGLAACDVSTGLFTLTELRGGEARTRLNSELARIRPAEVLLAPELTGDAPLSRFLTTQLGATISACHASNFSEENARAVLLRHFRTTSLAGFGCEGMPLAITAAGAALAYLRETQKVDLSHIVSLSPYLGSDYLQIDPASRRNLELTRSLRDGGRRGTLLWVLDETVTAIGARRLRDWVDRPLVDPGTINRRLDAVEELVGAGERRRALRSSLKSIYDLERLAGRLAYRTATPRDLLSLRDSLSALPHVKALLGQCRTALLGELNAAIATLDSERSDIERAIRDDAPPGVKEGGIIKPGYDAEVDRLRSAGGEGRDWIARLEAEERERTGIKSLKIGYNKVFGYYIAVTRSNLAAVPDDYQRKQTLANEERYITPALKEQEDLVLRAEERLVAREYELFVELRERIAAAVGQLQATAAAVAAVDALASLAEVAVMHNYVRPVVDAGEAIEIREGRHPVVEQVLPTGTFVPNDCQLDRDAARLLIVTGPNMAGKSTYIRQVALLVIMAQLGSFVPASAARIGAVDRVYTRVGAADDLTGGQSTFMVEMNEVSNILHNATPRSLVILDEVGRGTSTFDGLSIAWAVAEFLHAPERRVKTLFATHYHELTDLEELYPGAVNYTVAVKEQGADDVIFLHQITRGAADKSYGIHVARLAGLPAAVLKRAREILGLLESSEQFKKGQREVAASGLRRRSVSQVSLFGNEPDPLIEELKQLKVMEMTPLDALNKLYELQEKARSK